VRLGRTTTPRHHPVFHCATTTGTAPVFRGFPHALDHRQHTGMPTRWTTLGYGRCWWVGWAGRPCVDDERIPTVVRTPVGPTHTVPQTDTYLWRSVDNGWRTAGNHARPCIYPLPTGHPRPAFHHLGRLTGCYTLPRLPFVLMTPLPHTTSCLHTVPNRAHAYVLDHTTPPRYTRDHRTPHLPVTTPADITLRR